MAEGMTPIPCYLSVIKISTLMLLIYLQNSEPLFSFLPRSARKKLNPQSEVLKMMLLPLIKLIMLSIYAPRFINTRQFLFSFPGESRFTSSCDDQTLSLGLFSCSNIMIMSYNVSKLSNVGLSLKTFSRCLLSLC